MRGLSSRPAWTMPALKISTALLAITILAQAVLAGRGWFIDIDLIAVHGYLGNAVFIVAIVHVILVYLSGLRNAVLVMSAAILLLIFAQVGLGYAGRESAMAASLHVPNGVLLFGLTTASCMQVFAPRHEMA
jgi:hypothetical protein